MSSSSLVSWFASFGIWNWFLLGGVLLALELVAPGTFMLWFGIAAITVGVISIFVDWTWQLQLIAFGVLSLVSILAWRRLGHRVEPAGDRPFLNRRADAFVGRIFTLEKPIVDGSGTLRIDDTVWRITGPDSPAGSRVRVASADGTTLIVNRAET